MSFYTVALFALLAGEGVCANLQARQQPYGFWNASSSTSTSSSTSLSSSTSQSSSASLSSVTSLGSSTNLGSSTSLDFSTSSISTSLTSLNGTGTILVTTSNQDVSTSPSSITRQSSGYEASSQSSAPRSSSSSTSSLSSAQNSSGLVSSSLSSAQSSLAPTSSILIPVQSSSGTASSHPAYSTGTLPKTVLSPGTQATSTQTSTSLTSTTLAPPLETSASVTAPSESASASASLPPALEIVSPTISKTALQVPSIVSDTETSIQSSSWQVGISPSAFVTSAIKTGGQDSGVTSKSRSGGLGSIIWSGLSGILPTGDTDSDGSGNINPSTYSAFPTGNSPADVSVPVVVSGQSGSSPAPVGATNPANTPGSNVLTGSTGSPPTVNNPTDGFGPGTGSGGPINVIPTFTSPNTLVQTPDGQGFPTGRKSSATWSPRYSFSWKFNTTATRRPLGTGSAAPTGYLPPKGNVPPTGNISHLPPRPSPHYDEECGGITVNIPSATLDYWYSTALDYAAATFSVQFDGNDSSTGWTLIPATTTFNVTEALQSPTTRYLGSTVIASNTYSTAVSYITSVEVSPTPVYASTAVVTQTATNSLSSSSGIGGLPPDAVITPPPASTVLSAGPNDFSLTALTNTHFVYFSEYALDTEHKTTYRNGSKACATSREVRDLGMNFAMYYDGDDPDGQAEVIGTLPEEFLRLLPPHLKLAVGVFTAQPTLIVPVQIDYAAEAVLAITAEPTATSFLAFSSAPAQSSYYIVPAPTVPGFTPLRSSALPPVIFLKPTTTSSVAVTASVLATNHYIVSPTTKSGHIEVTQTGSLNLGLKPGPTKLPQQNEGSGSSDSDANGGSNSGNTGQSSGSSGSGSQGNGGSSSNGGSSGGSSNSGSNGSSSNAGSNGGSSNSGSNGGSNSNGNSGSSAGNSPSGNGNDGSSGNSNSGGSSSGSSSNGQSSGNNGSGSNSGGSSSGGSNSGGSGSSSGNSGGSSSGGSDSGGSSGGSNSGGSSSGGSGSNSGSSGSSSSGGSGSGGSSGGSNSGGSSSGGSSSGGSSGSSNSGGSNSGGSSGASNSGGSQQGGNAASGSNNNNGGSGSNGGSSPGSNGGSGGQIVVPVPLVITIGSTKATVNPGSTIVIDSQTLVPEKAAVTIGGTRVSIGPSAVVVGTETHNFQGSTIQAPGPVAPTAITFGGSIITQAPVPVYNVGGTPVRAGQVVTISGTVVSAAPSGGVLVIGSETVSLAVPDSPVTLSTGGKQVIVNPTPAFVVGGQTLEAGGPAVTVDGTHLSLAPSATAIVVGSETSPIASPAGQTRGALLTIGSKTFTADAATRFSLGPDLTLTPGGSATVEGTTVHLGPSGFLASLAVVDGVTQTLAPPLITPAPAFYMGGTGYQTNGGSAFVVDGQVLTPGGVITVSNTVVSFASEGTAVIVNGFTQSLAQTHATGAPVLNVGGQAYTPQDGSAFVVGGQTLTRGGVITVSGTTISLGSQGTAAVVNGVTQSLAQATPPPVLSVGGQTYTARSGSNFIINGATLTPGGVITVDGTTVSLASGGTAAIVNGVTQSFAQATPAHVLTVGGQAYTATSGPNYVVGGQTLTPGGIITVDGTTISLANGATAAVINGVTQTLSQPTAAAVLNIGGQYYTAQAGSAFVIGGQTLSPGGVVTVDGTTVSLARGGTAAVVNGVTQALSQATAAAVLNIGGKTYTAQAGSAFVIGGQTLSPGSAVTVDGTTVSLERGGTVAVVNGVTQTLSQATAAAVLDIGGETYTAQANSAFVVRGQTLSPGSEITVDGTTISLARGGTVAVVNGVTETLAQATPSPVVTIGGHAYTAQSGSSYVIDGKTLTPGGVVTLAGGTIVSLGSSASFVVINGVTSTIPRAAGASPTSVLTVGGRIYTAISGSYVIDGQTLTSGGVVTLVDGTTLSLGASVLVINGQTSTLPAAAPFSLGVISIGDNTFRPLSGTGAHSYVIAGQTLRPAGSEATVTISGRTYIVSLGAGARTVEIELLGPDGHVTATIYETLLSKGAGPTTVTATASIQGGANASPTSRPGSTPASTSGGRDASLQNVAPRDGVIGASVAFAAIMAGALAVWL